MSAARFLGDTAKWTLGAGLIAATHAGAAYWLEQADHDILAPPAPIVVELVLPPKQQAEPAAMAEQQDQPATQPDAAPSAVPMRPDFKPLEPIEDFAELVPIVQTEPLRPQMAVLPPIDDFSTLIPPSFLVLASSERPISRPSRPLKSATREPSEKKPAKDRNAKRAAAAAPVDRQQSAPASAQRKSAPDAKGGATLAANGSASTPVAREAWAAKARVAISRHMLRTRIPGLRQTVRVQLIVTVGANGVASARLAGTTGHAGADAAISRQAARMRRLAPPPDGRSESLSLPIDITR